MWATALHGIYESIVLHHAICYFSLATQCTSVLCSTAAGSSPHSFANGPGCLGARTCVGVLRTRMLARSSCRQFLAYRMSASLAGGSQLMGQPTELCVGDLSPQIGGRCQPRFLMDEQCQHQMGGTWLGHGAYILLSCHCQRTFTEREYTRFTLL